MARDWTQDEVIKDLERVIEKQDAGIERLREDKLDALAAVESENAFYQEEIELLRKERDGLRETLRVIGHGPPNEGEPLELLNQFVDIARAALKGDE